MNRWHDTSYDTAVTTKLYDTSLPLRTAAFAAHHNAGQKMTDETGVQSPEVCADWELREDACEYQDAVDTLLSIRVPGLRHTRTGASLPPLRTRARARRLTPHHQSRTPPPTASSQRRPPNRRTI